MSPLGFGTEFLAPLTATGGFTHLCLTEGGGPGPWQRRGSLTHLTCTPCLPTHPERAVWLLVAGAAGREPHLLAGGGGAIISKFAHTQDCGGSPVWGN